MRVIVGSENTPKRQAAEASFVAAFPREQIIVDGVKTNSGVSSHPTTAEESITGALNRAEQARLLKPEADFYVGIEGGLLKVGERAWEIGWVAVVSAAGQNATGLSAGIEIQGKILSAICDGEELNDVLANDHGIKSAGNANGFYGLATNDLVTRQAAYEQGITFALARFLHPEFYSDHNK
jgi:inosine/xanthosine triphosphatase